MAIVHNGTVNQLKAVQLPAGYTRPTVTKVADYHYKRTITLSVLKATVESATPATTMTNIFNDATIGLNKQIEDILALDYLASADITSYATIAEITTNYKETKGTDDMFTDTAASYICTVKLYVKAL